MSGGACSLGAGPLGACLLEEDCSPPGKQSLSSFAICSTSHVFTLNLAKYGAFAALRVWELGWWLGWGLRWVFTLNLAKYAAFAAQGRVYGVGVRFESGLG